MALADLPDLLKLGLREAFQELIAQGVPVEMPAALGGAPVTPPPTATSSNATLNQAALPVTLA